MLLIPSAKICPFNAITVPKGYSPLLTAIRDSGYTGPIGILGHTQDDAAERLVDNLDGLAWLTAKLDGKDAAKPKWRTYRP